MGGKKFGFWFSFVFCLFVFFPEKMQLCYWGHISKILKQALCSYQMYSNGKDYTSFTDILRQ